MIGLAGLAKMGAEVSSGEPELMRLLSHIQDANARLARLHEQGLHMANRLLGTLPEDMTAGVKAPSWDGLVPMLNDAVNDLHALISQCDDDMRRLSAL